MENVKINISARHVHLTEDAINILFHHDLTKRNNLNQLGQFASNETVTIKASGEEIKNVRVVGPARSYNQVEISKSDARKLEINPPIRKSGDLSGAEEITIETEFGSITGNFAIIADRHIHFSKSDAENFNIQDDDELKLYIDGIKKGVVYVHARVSDDGFFEAHLDTDDANAFLLDKNAVGRMEK